jgi:hypothetical protein
MCSGSKVWLNPGFDLSGFDNPMTWIDLCISSNEVAGCLCPGVSSSYFRDEVPGKINTVCKNFDGNSAESLEL